MEAVSVEAAVASVPVVKEVAAIVGVVIVAEVEGAGRTFCCEGEMACLLAADGIVNSLRRLQGHSGLAEGPAVVAVVVVRVDPMGSCCQTIYRSAVDSLYYCVHKQVCYSQQSYSLRLEQQQWTGFEDPKMV